MARIRKSIGVLVISISSICLAQDSAKEAYVEAYSAHLRSSISIIAKGFESEGAPEDQARQEAEALVAKAIDCHVRYVDEYPESLQAALFQTIASGGSYPDAESVLENFVIEVQFAGDEAAVKEFMAATEKGVNCIKS